MSKLLTLEESANEACKLFHCFDEEMPDLVGIGIGALDRAIGGLHPGSAGILAAGTGVGKSSIILSSALSCKHRVGIVSCEDTPDIVGSRALAWASGVDSLRIRTKTFSDKDRDSLRRGISKLRKLDNIRVAYEIGSTLDEVLRSIDKLAAAGCRLIWLDYIQKIRGVGADRRNEVAGVFTAVQRACDRAGVACMMASQFSRQADPTRPPQIWWLKESGDLENEARLILLASRDPKDNTVVSMRVAKSTFGGEGLFVSYKRDSSGTLREVTEYDQKEDF